jgi:hypothetical protein
MKQKFSHAFKDLGLAKTDLQRRKTENSKRIFPTKEMQGLSPNSHIHVSVSFFLSISTIGLPVLLQENMWTDPGTIKYKSLTDMWNRD